MVDLGIPHCPLGQPYRQSRAFQLGIGMVIDQVFDIRGTAGANRVVDRVAAAPFSDREPVQDAKINRSYCHGVVYYTTNFMPSEGTSKFATPLPTKMGPARLELATLSFGG